MFSKTNFINKDKDKDFDELRDDVIWVTGHSGGFNSPRGREFSESASDHQESVDSGDDEDCSDDDEDGGDDEDHNVDEDGSDEDGGDNDEDGASCKIHLWHSKFLTILIL